MFTGSVGHSGYQRTSHQHRMKHCFCFIIFVNYITYGGVFTRSLCYFCAFYNLIFCASLERAHKNRRKVKMYYYCSFIST
ncbi:hypothetical protein DM684_10455 [Salmonella bongori]|nr:hypothetical protein [Salmonella bongori]ECE6547796.1 hypothetical protein [Salmonella bongori]ECI3518500.1 hypothetical protein [Salmonella bongori]